MQLGIKKTIFEDNVGVEISVDTLGSATLTPDEEREQLDNFKKYIKYSDLTFKKNVKVVDGLPVVTDESPDPGNIIEVEVKNLISQEIVLDESLFVSFSIDAKKIPETELEEPLATKELMAQAIVTVFTQVIQDAIKAKLTEIRAINTDFEIEESVVL